VVEEQAENVNVDPETMRSIVEKLKAWSDSLSPAEQVMLGLLLKRLDEGQPIERLVDDSSDLPIAE
jgi:hypothetical protein